MRKKKISDGGKTGGTKNVIKVVEIELDNCQKCAQVKRRMKEISDSNAEITFRSVNAKEFSRNFFLENGLTAAPILMVYRDAEFLGFIKVGFTPRRLKMQLEEITGIGII